MGRARLGGAGVVLVARDKPGNDGLQRVGFGCGEGFKRFKRRRRDRVPLSTCSCATAGANGAPARAAAPAAPTRLNTLRRDTSRGALSSVSLAMNPLLIQFFAVLLRRSYLTCAVVRRDRKHLVPLPF